MYKKKSVLLLMATVLSIGLTAGDSDSITENKKVGSAAESQQEDTGCSVLTEYN